VQRSQEHRAASNFALSLLYRVIQQWVTMDLDVLLVESWSISGIALGSGLWLAVGLAAPSCVFVWIPTRLLRYVSCSNVHRFIHSSASKPIGTFVSYFGFSSQIKTVCVCVCVCARALVAMLFDHLLVMPCKLHLDVCTLLQFRQAFSCCYTTQ
jgi:hypothetical protein